MNITWYLGAKILIHPHKYDMDGNNQERDNNQIETNTITVTNLTRNQLRSKKAKLRRENKRKLLSKQNL